MAGLVCAFAYCDSYKESKATFIGYAVFPGLSAITLFVLGIYALTQFNLTTQIVGIGGLVIGIIFYRPNSYSKALLAPAELFSISARVEARAGSSRPFWLIARPSAQQSRRRQTQIAHYEAIQPLLFP